MSKRLFVGSLPYETTDSQLSELFSQIGPVESVTIVMDRFTGRSKGFAFIDMADEDALKAIEKLNGTDFGGRNIVVNEARPREERGTRDFGGGRGGQDRRGGSGRRDSRGGYRQKRW